MATANQETQSPTKTENISSESQKGGETTDWKAKYNAKNIHNLTYEEILKLNREKNKDTFIDRSWRDKALDSSILDDPTLSRWKKFTAGAYSVDTIGRSFAQKLAIRQHQVEFIESMIENKNNFEDERDRLILKKVETKVLNTFNMYRIPFVAGSFTVCVLIFFRLKKPLHVRMFPILFIGGFSSMYNYQVGQYGIHKNLDKILAVMADKNDTEIGKKTLQLIDEIDRERAERQAKAMQKSKELFKDKKKNEMLPRDVDNASTTNFDILEQMMTRPQQQVHLQQQLQSPQQNMQAQSMMLGDSEIIVRHSDAMNFEPEDMQRVNQSQFMMQQQQIQSLGQQPVKSHQAQSVLPNHFQFLQNHNMDIFDQIHQKRLNLNSSNGNSAFGSNNNEAPVPIFCSLHGRHLEFFCFDDKQRICSECVRNQHKTHKFNFINVCANINKEVLDYLKLRTSELQLERKIVHDKNLNDFKLQIRKQILDIKDQSIIAINDACNRILSQINRGDLKNTEREMELFQTFFYNKIQNFNFRIKSAMDQVQRALREEKYHEVMLEKEKIESFEQEIQILGDQINLKRHYFEASLAKIKNSLDLSSFQQIKERAEMAQRSLELFSKEHRIAAFVPNKKQIIMHDLKYFTSKVINVQEMEHTFGNFSTILQSQMNGKIYICGGKQRKKLFEFDDMNGSLIERAEMHFGRSNHAFVEVTLTGELIAIGGWDGERSMSQAEGFTICNNIWRHLPRLVEERHSLSACRLGNSFIYAIGGSSAINYGSSLSTIERLNFTSPNFDGATHWELIFLFGQCCDAKRSQLGSISLSDNQIMLFGGFLDTDLTNMCFMIDTNTFEIAKMDCVMRKSKKFIKFKDYTLRENRFIYVIDDENEIHQYDQSKNQWMIVETNREN